MALKEPRTLHTPGHEQKKTPNVTRNTLLITIGGIIVVASCLITALRADQKAASINSFKN